MYGGYFRQHFYARKRRAARALTFPPRVSSVVTSRAAAPRPSVIAAAHPEVLLHSAANSDQHASAEISARRSRASPR